MGNNRFLAFLTMTTVLCGLALPVCTAGNLPSEELLKIAKDKALSAERTSTDLQGVVSGSDMLEPSDIQQIIRGNRLSALGYGTQNQNMLTSGDLSPGNSCFSSENGAVYHRLPINTIATASIHEGVRDLAGDSLTLGAGFSLSPFKCSIESVRLSYRDLIDTPNQGSNTPAGGDSNPAVNPVPDEPTVDGPPPLIN